MSINYGMVVEKVADTLVRAGSTFRPDQKDVYQRSIATEELVRARWNLETILENACVAEQCKSPLCDYTGIPHVFIEAGPERAVTGNLLKAIREGVAAG
jgi:fumarate hydratase subunit alpha